MLSQMKIWDLAIPKDSWSSSRSAILLSYYNALSNEDNEILQCQDTQYQQVVQQF